MIKFCLHCGREIYIDTEGHLNKHLRNKLVKKDNLGKNFLPVAYSFSPIVGNLVYGVGDVNGNLMQEAPH